MKQVLRIILIFITFSTSYNLSGQVLGKFGVNQSTLDPNAVLEVESTSKGVLLPRLTTAQQNAMSAPTNGMLIYNTDSACFVLRRAGIWRSLCAANGGEAWSNLGNTGTNANTNFLGTTDGQALVVKTNNVERMRVSSTGNVGIGIATPAYALDVFAATNPMRLQGLANGASSDSILTIDPSTGLVRKSTMSAIKLTDLPLGSTSDSFVVINNGFIHKLGIDDVIGTYAWSLDGNAGTVDGTNFIGTTDNIPFNIRVNNEKAGRIDNAKANAFFGYQSGNATTTGTRNTAIGDQALKVNTTGSNNIALGSGALKAATTADGNTAVGVTALQANTTGFNNNAIGYQSLLANTTGAYNIGVGNGTLQANTTGQYNVAIGDNALNHNTTASNNVAIGGSVLQANTTGTGNTAVGTNALTANTTGNNNTALGNATLQTNTTGYQNIAIGESALNGNTSGFANLGIGNGALLTNTTGTYNIGIGNAALQFNTTGTYNAALGFNSLQTNTTGGSNTAIGISALYGNTTGATNAALGRDALIANTTGSNNVALGYRAGFTNTTGGNNTLIGYQANVSAVALTNATAIGYNAIVGASNSLVLGGTGADAVNVGIGTTTPSVKMDVDGAFALRPSSTSITADNQAVTVSNRSFLRLTSDGTPANRTITLSNGLQDGQQLVIRVIGAAGFGIELADSGNLNLSGLAQLDDGDTITLIWDGTIWYELYRSSN